MSEQRVQVSWRQGTLQDPFIDIHEPTAIINSVVILSEIPDEFTRVIFEGYFETKSNTPKENEYYVNYSNGVVLFHPSQENKLVNAEYKGRGVILTPASRIILNNPNRPDLNTTLQEILDIHQDVVDHEATYDQFRQQAEQAVADAESATTAANEAASNANASATNANTAADSANQAVVDVEAAIVSANTATTNATTAADSANSAASSANTAKISADTATANANAATTAANQAATEASTAASNATTAAGTANSAATSANTAKTNAEAATVAANTARDNAVTATNAANEATTSANTAASNANTAASNANQAATAANTAKVNTEKATTDAVEATTAANTATANANEATVNANTAATAANTAKANADTATSSANDATTRANNAADSANTAATAANTAKANADTATANANAATSSANDLVANTVHKGEWVNSTAYKKNNIVSKNGNSYMAIVDNTGVDVSDAGTWKLMSLKGDQGIQGIKGDKGDIGITWRGVWSSATTYAVNDGVHYNGSAYICITANTNVAPTDTTAWSIFAVKGTDGAGTVISVTSASSNVVIGGTPENPTIGLVDVITTVGGQQINGDLSIWNTNLATVDSRNRAVQQPSPKLNFIWNDWDSTSLSSVKKTAFIQVYHDTFYFYDSAGTDIMEVSSNGLTGVKSLTLAHNTVDDGTGKSTFCGDMLLTTGKPAPTGSPKFTLESGWYDSTNSIYHYDFNYLQTDSNGALGFYIRANDNTTEGTRVWSADKQGNVSASGAINSKSINVNSGFFSVDVDNGVQTANGVILDDGGGSSVLPYASISTAIIGWALILNPMVQATSSATLQNSVKLEFNGSYWNGSSASVKRMSIQVDGNGMMSFMNNSSTQIMTVSQDGSVKINSVTSNGKVLAVNDTSSTEVFSVDTSAKRVTTLSIYANNSIYLKTNNSGIMFTDTSGTTSKMISLDNTNTFNVGVALYKLNVQSQSTSFSSAVTVGGSVTSTGNMVAQTSSGYVEIRTANTMSGDYAYFKSDGVNVSIGSSTIPDAITFADDWYMSFANNLNVTFGGNVWLYSKINVVTKGLTGSNQWIDIESKLREYNMYASSVDANGIYTILEYKRFDGKLYMNSTLSNPDSSGNYQTETIKYYDTDGTSLNSVEVWTITYDTAGKVVSRVRTS